MSKQKYFYNGRDLVKTRKSEINFIITLIFALVGLLSFFITPSYSLGWQDEEWLKPGCPKTVSGIWAADNPDNTNLKLLSINNKEFIYISKNDQKDKFGIIKSSFVFSDISLLFSLEANPTAQVPFLGYSTNTTFFFCLSVFVKVSVI